MKLSRSVCVTGISLAALSNSASAQTAQALVRETDLVTGLPAHTVTSLGDVAVNNAHGFGVLLTTTDGITVLSSAWGNAGDAPGAVLFNEQNNIAGYDQTSWEGFFGIDDTAQVAYSPSCTVTGGGPTGLDCAWLDGTPIAVEGQPILTVPGKVFRFNSRVGTTAAGAPYWVGGINDGTSGANEGEGLFLGAAQTAVIKTGDASPAPLTSTISNVDFDVRYSALGSHWIMNVDTTDVAAGDEWMLIDGAIATCAGGGMVGEGQAIPAAAGGIGGELWTATFGGLGINEAGDHVYEADTSGPTGSDAVIVKNGVITWREGQVVDGQTLLAAPLLLHMNENGDVAFVWNTVGNFEALFLNGTLILLEGDVVDWTGDGVADAGHVVTDITGSASQIVGARSPSGAVELYVTADVNTPGGVLEALFRIRVGPTGGVPFCFGDGSGSACPCGNTGLAGNGCASSIQPNGGNLASSGTSSIGADTLVLLGTGMPSSSALYFQGTTQISSPFGDGLRCAGGTITRLGTKTNDGSGASQYPVPGDLSVSVRGGCVAGDIRTYQCWYRNAAAFCTPSTFNLTNGLSVTWGA